MPAKTTDDGDIAAIMGDGPEAAEAEGSEPSGPTYDIWYLLKALLVLIIIVGVVDYFFNKRPKIKAAEDEEDDKPVKRKSKK